MRWISVFSTTVCIIFVVGIFYTIHGIIEFKLIADKMVSQCRQQCNTVHFKYVKWDSFGYCMCAIPMRP